MGCWVERVRLDLGGFQNGADGGILHGGRYGIGDIIDAGGVGAKNQNAIGTGKSRRRVSAALVCGTTTDGNSYIKRAVSANGACFRAYCDNLKSVLL